MPAWNVHFGMVVQTTDPQLVKAVAEIHALAGVIRGIPIPPSIQEQLDRLNILRAVRGTTGIEGNELSEEEVGLIMEAPDDGAVLEESRSREEQEVKNADTLMNVVARLLGENPDIPISEGLLKEFHRILTHGIDYPNNVPGQYRSHAVAAGDYVPPRTAEEVSSLMSEFIRWFNNDEPTTWDPVIRAIAAHFYVISIHPFGDGNGRTSRAIESYLLYKAGVNARGYYSLANYYYSRRPDYVERLDHVRFRSDPDLTPFIIFAVRGLVDELIAVHDEVLAAVRKISFRDFARETLTAEGKIGTPGGERQLFLLMGLSEEPVSIRALRNGRHLLSGLYKDVTSKTLMRDINFLRQHDLVIVEGDDLVANWAIMTSFTALNAPNTYRT